MKVTGPGARAGRSRVAPVSRLEAGMDFRKPAYRREVFHRFYTFHLKYRTHPGCVYFLMPWLAAANGWDAEQRLWFAFLNGNTQNPVTSWLIFRAVPRLPETPADLGKLGAFFAREYARLEFDSDRRHWKKELLVAVDRYRNLVRNAGGSQRALFDLTYGATPTPLANFGRLWRDLGPELYGFGRLSLFSYFEYLRAMGEPVECDSLFLHDILGSKSHRNGLARVLGRDDLDWHDSNPAFNGRYSDDVLAWLSFEGSLLLQEARQRNAGQPWARDVGYFTLESALCTYKSWHRPNRRYPNVYADMLYLRLQKAEKLWRERFTPFWDARRAILHPALRLEDNPADPGLVPAKQNHYLETGEVVMMDIEWECFRNSFNDAIRAKAAGAA